MTIDKAIETLENELDCWRLHPRVALPLAIKLGIESLKRLKKARDDNYLIRYNLLPGETK